LIKVILN